MDIQDILNKLYSVHEVRRGWMAKCPAHDDRTPSLSVAKGKDGQLLLHCFAGCSLAEVLDAIGVKIEDLFPKKQQLG